MQSNSNDTTNPKNEQISSIIKSYATIDKYLGNLRQIAQNLLKTSEAITQHVNSGDIKNHERNAELWHGLNNIEHQMKLFTTYTEDSIKEFSATTMQLIATLHKMRPPKDM